MSGAWAREADSAVCLEAWSLPDAALWLADSLNCTDTRRPFCLLNASAIIRRERKRLDPEGVSKRSRDWPETVSDEALIWAALRMVASVDVAADAEDRAWYLRQAEAVLRTLYARQRSGSR